jgi:hypothetical protein
MHSNGEISRPFWVYIVSLFVVIQQIPININGNVESSVVIPVVCCLLLGKQNSLIKQTMLFVGLYSKLFSFMKFSKKQTSLNVRPSHMWNPSLRILIPWLFSHLIRWKIISAFLNGNSFSGTLYTALMLVRQLLSCPGRTNSKDVLLKVPKPCP